jgi:hypothetical protein
MVTASVILMLINIKNNKTTIMRKLKNQAFLLFACTTLSSCGTMFSVFGKK